MSFFKEGKDRLVSQAARTAADHFIKEFGTMLDFSIDSENKRIFLEVLLKGEKESLKLNIYNYNIATSGDSSYLEFQKIYTSREWLNIVIDKYLDKVLPGHRIKIPSEAAKMLSIIV